MSRVAQPGFMLFELMLVIALIIICSTIGFISYNAVKGTSFATDVAVLSMLLRTAATRATCLKKEQKISIDESTSTLVYDGIRYALQEGFSFGVLPNVYGPPSSPQKLVTQAVTFVDKKIVAYPDGTLQSGTLYITNSQEQYALTTPVSAFSYIRVYRYRDSAWQSY
jgi:Tfp pilus assembly protein FimT